MSAGLGSAPTFYLSAWNPFPLNKRGKAISALPLGEITLLNATNGKHIKAFSASGFSMNIARLSKKDPWLFHANSGSLKIKKLQAMENQKMIEFGLFRQSQQLYSICKMTFPPTLFPYPAEYQLPAELNGYTYCSGKEGFRN